MDYLVMYFYVGFACMVIQMVWLCFSDEGCEKVSDALTQLEEAKRGFGHFYAAMLLAMAYIMTAWPHWMYRKAKTFFKRA